MFPLPVLAEQGDKIVMVICYQQFIQMLKAETLIGIGSRNRIKKLRFNRPVEKMIELRSRWGGLNAEDNKTTHFVSRTVSHHPERTFAYARGRGGLSAASL